MTELLERAFEEAAKLSAHEQDVVAAWLLEELESERRWTEAFSRSQDKLASLASEAITDHQNGRTEELDADAL